MIEMSRHESIGSNPNLCLQLRVLTIPKGVLRLVAQSSRADSKTRDPSQEATLWFSFNIWANVVMGVQNLFRSALQHPLLVNSKFDLGLLDLLTAPKPTKDTQARPSQPDSLGWQRTHPNLRLQLCLLINR